MASDRKIRANRKNARLSTGPLTSQGKARSSRNAIKHGLTARTSVIEGEDPKQFIAFDQALAEELAPAGAVESMLVERIISSAWRLRRIPAFETALFDHIYEEKRKESAVAPLVTAFGLNRDDFEITRDDNDWTRLKLGRAVEAMLKIELLGKLSRYESALQRQLASNLAELRAMQARRSSSK